VRGQPIRRRPDGLFAHTYAALGDAVSARIAGTDKDFNGDGDAELQWQWTR
jgi:hypothetical protein